MSSPLTEAYVFAHSPTGNPVLAGKLAITRTSGTFTYSEQWLEEPWAYPLDPVNLKLTSGQITTRNDNKVFPVFSDAGPDDWGTRVLLLGHTCCRHGASRRSRRGLPENFLESAH